MIPAAIREELAAHAAAELPNEACGLIVFEDGTAIRYEPGTNTQPSPHYFQLRPADPMTPFLEDEGYVVGLFHSHVSSPPRPSKTDVENARLDWPDRPFLIYSLRLDDLAAFTISEDGQIASVPLG